VRLREYYDRRAREYDDWYLGRGLFKERDRPGWAEELDVACGTGFHTRHLRGATFLKGDALALPVPNRSFDRVFTAHFYGHLDEAERERFLAEERRVARELVVVDSSRESSELAAELGGGETLFESRWFVAVRSA
jgi:ubiquinone/menaquinone biosynthesis C-methylase UbiE